MSSESDKRCGTCKWWSSEIDKHVYGVEFRRCRAPLPECLCETDTYPMSANDGESCPCHQRKEGAA